MSVQQVLCIGLLQYYFHIPNPDGYREHSGRSGACIRLAGPEACLRKSTHEEQVPAGVGAMRSQVDDDF